MGEMAAIVKKDIVLYDLEKYQTMITRTGNMTKLAPSTILLAGIQWLLFMFTNIVIIPLSVGAAFNLPPEEITASLQRAFIYTGIACILQAFIGHRYALMEGQSGLWWGVILSLSASASATGLSLSTVGGGFATGIMLSGLLIGVLGFLGLGKILRNIANPIVVSVYMMLLSSQLIFIFFKGMLGLTEQNQINVPVAFLSLAIVLLVAWLHIKGNGLISNFAILIGITIGWIAYVLLFPQNQTAFVASTSTFTLFPLGAPNFEIGIIIIALITGLVNSTNTVASLKGAEQLYATQTSQKQYKRSFMVTGFNSVISGLFGLVPYTPYASSIGFLQSTRILQRSPFIVGALLFILMGLIPALAAFFSALPMSIGHAVLFVAYFQLFGTALRSIEGIRFNSKTIYRIAAPVLIGISIMNMPAVVFQGIPMMIRPLLASGLLVGVIISLLLENLIDWSKYEAKAAE
jgi:xanthine/uracil permease